MKNTFGVPRFLSLIVAICSVGVLGTNLNSFAQELEPAFSKLPQLKSVFDSKLQKSTRSKFEDGDKTKAIDWFENGLRLKNGGEVNLRQESGPWLELELDVLFSELKRNGENCDLKIELELTEIGSTFVWLRQKKEKGAIRSAVFVGVTYEKGTRVIGEPLKLDGPLTNGQWKMTYRYGLWHIENPNSKTRTLTRYTGAGFKRPGIRNFKFTATGSDNTFVQISHAKLQAISSAFSPLLTPDPKSKNYRAVNQMFSQARNLHHYGSQELGVNMMEKAINKGEKIYGKYHPDFLLHRGNLFVMRNHTGDASIKDCQDTVKSVAKLLGTYHWEYANMLERLAGCYDRSGRLDESVECFRQAIEVRLRLTDKSDFWIHFPKRNMAEVLFTLGRYREADEICRNVVAAFNAKSKKELELLSSTHSLLAKIQAMTGELEDAKKSIAVALDFAEKCYGKNQVRYGSTLVDKGIIYSLNEEPEEAIVYLEQAKKIFKNKLAPGAEYYLLCIFHLSDAYLKSGKVEEATTLFSSGMKKLENTVGDLNPGYAMLSIHAGHFYNQIGDAKSAIKHLNNAKRILEFCLGGDSIQSAEIYVVLSIIFGRQKDYSEAIDFAKKAQSIYEKFLGKQNHRAVNCNQLIAQNYRKLGDLENALAYAQKSLKNLPSDLTNHSQTASSIEIAMIHQQAGRNEKAYAVYIQELERVQNELVTKFRGQTIRQNRIELFLAKAAMDRYLNLAVQASVSPKEIYARLLGWKGLDESVHKLQSRIQHQSQNDSDVKQLVVLNRKLQLLFEKLPEQKTQLTAENSQMLYKSMLQNWRTEVAGIQRKIEAIEKKLSGKIADEGHAFFGTSFSSVVSQIPVDGLLIDFVSYKSSVPNSGHTGQFEQEQRIIAFLIDNKGNVGFKQLGSADKIAKAVDQWHKMITQDASRKQVEDVGLNVKSMLWDPLGIKLNKNAKIIVCPSGELAKLSFNALPGTTSQSFLIEDYDISSISAPEFLVRSEIDKSKRNSKFLLVGNVDYHSGASIDKTNKKKDAAEQKKWIDLPGTEIEVNSVVQIIAAEKRIKKQLETKQLTGKAATATSVAESLSGCRYAHIATHGFFRKDQLSSAMQDASTHGHTNIDGSVDLAYLNVSGGIQTGLVLASEKKPAASEMESVSILSGEQLAYLDLRGMDLLTLSACETGIGSQSFLGDSVLSLRRSIHVAGVKSSVTSLWKVHDMATQQIMVRFYNNLIVKKMTKSQAIREAQIWFLRNPVGMGEVERHRGEPVQIDTSKITESKSSDASSKHRSHPRYWAAFMLSGDWK